MHHKQTYMNKKNMLFLVFLKQKGNNEREKKKTNNVSVQLIRKIVIYKPTKSKILDNKRSIY